MRRDRITRRQSDSGNGGWMYCDRDCPWLNKADGECRLLDLDLDYDRSAQMFLCHHDCSFPDEDTREFLEG